MRDVILMHRILRHASKFIEGKIAVGKQPRRGDCHLGAGRNGMEAGGETLMTGRAAPPRHPWRCSE
jgi:hypothetical protein